MLHSRWIFVPAALIWVAGLSISPPAAARSALRVEAPRTYGKIPATTYDLDRTQVGNAGLFIEKNEDGSVSMSLVEGFTRGARTVVRARLEPVGDGMLAPVHQESRSFDTDGTPLGILTVDHKASLATCTSPKGEVHEIPLPNGDRVANSTLNLLLLPLVRGELEEIDFQLFLCRGGARLVDFVANLAPASRQHGASEVVEVRYGPDFGFASIVARSFVPKLSVWFETSAPYKWLAHRLPLYSGGPEVFVIRNGVPLRWLGNE